MRLTLAIPVAILMFLLPLGLGAQEQTGALEGKVIDASGAVLPGVSVTIAGPALLGGSRTVATSGTGSYRIPILPVGTYRVSFELAGFKTKNYEAVRIQAGTTYTVNATLEVAGIEEAVTVTGESPVIETAANALAFTFTEELMDTVPNARDAWALVAQTPGVVTNRVNVGGTETGNQLAFRGHGVDPRQNTYILNGANVTDNTNNGASQFYFDVDSFEEVQVQVSSHSAEVQTPGMVLNIIPKSGSNKLSGSYSLYFGNEGIQSTNVDDQLRSLGVNRASNLNQYLDTGGDIGGPIIKDKLWFWGGYRWQEIERFVTGTVNPDGSFPIDRTYLWYPSAKVNWQISPQHNFSSYFNMAQKKRFKRGLSATRPVETTTDQQGAPVARLLTFRDDWTASPNLLVNFKVNIMDQGFELIAQQNVDTSTTPARFDEATGVWGGAPPNELGIAKNLKSAGVTASYYVDNWLGGQHEFKLGFEVAQFGVFGNQKGSVAVNTYPADHRLIFFNGQPTKVILFAADAQSVNNPSRSAFIQDSWRAGRLRLNLGARWDWQANSLNGVTAPESRFLPPVTQEKTDNLITWNTLAPRLGVVYDVTGDARTLLKAGYSRYYWQLWVDKGQQAGVAGNRSRTHAWIDRNGDRQFTIDELGDLLSAEDPRAGRSIEPDLAPTFTDEFTVGFARELAANLSVAGTYMYRKDKDLSWTINPGISPADYSPVVGTDPGPDGRRGTADDGGAITFFEIDAAKRGLSPNLIATRPGFEQEYQGFELTLNRRYADNWQLVAALTVGVQRENYGEGSFQNPQDIAQSDGTRIADSTPYIGKIMGSYTFPHKVTVSGFYQYVSGNNFTRTVNAISALGRSLNQGNVTALAGTRNEESYDGLNILDLRVAYDLPWSTPRLSFAFDLFNVLNVNTITSTVVISGSNFGRVLDFVPPRIARFAVKVRF
jgi:hypothetical protein